MGLSVAKATGREHVSVWAPLSNFSNAGLLWRQGLPMYECMELGARPSPAGNAYTCFVTNLKPFAKSRLSTFFEYLCGKNYAVDLFRSKVAVFCLAGECQSTSSVFPP